MTVTLLDLVTELRELEIQHYQNSMSDNFYYTNGGYYRMEDKLKSLRRRIQTYDRDVNSTS